MPWWDIHIRIWDRPIFEFGDEKLDPPQDFIPLTTTTLRRETTQCSCRGEQFPIANGRRS
jgi:hypothetical protein